MASLNISTCSLQDVLIIEPKVFKDDRGFFFESFNSRAFKVEAGVEASFVQDNHSRSKRHVLRGLHYQLGHPQGKLVRVANGEVFDVAVDLRKNSPTCGKWEGFHLSGDTPKFIWIPPGFAHGFLVLSENADFLYKTTQFYDPSSEYCIKWNDINLNINWPLDGIKPVVSYKDSQGLTFKEAPLFEDTLDLLI